MALPLEQLLFADLCEVGSSEGGLPSIAAVSHVPVPVPASLVLLASAGCSAPDLSSALGRPVIRQTVTAPLRHACGFDHWSAGPAH